MVLTAALWALLCAAVPASSQVPPPAPQPPGGNQPFAFAPTPFDAPSSTSSAPAAPAAAAVASTAPVAVLAQDFGQPLSISGGPWVFSEALFTSGGKIISDYAWRDKLRGLKDQLYSSADLSADLAALRGLKVFDRITPSVYAIANSPVPTKFASVAVSTTEVRVVFEVAIKPVVKPKPILVTPPVAVSGLILTPTAYRGLGHYNTPGLGLDFNAAYYIGRLYGKNSYPYAPMHTNYLDRIGLWLLSADGKMQIQSETEWRPAMAVGTQGILMFHDAPQPTVNTPTVQTTINQQTMQVLGDAYVVASKENHGVRYSAGIMEGTIGDLAENLTEFLTPQDMQFYKNAPAGTMSQTRTVPFMSMFYLVKPDYPIGFEVMKFSGASGSPTLINMKIGRALKLNFDLGLLTFQGGYDLLGLIQFRFNEFPNR
ncbi:MAG: hypothetical protein HKL90_07110 [Elusimicrobia bacterium]|nr:hypothetical protein [Elusimicrobiota bacterium]